MLIVTSDSSEGSASEAMQVVPRHSLIGDEFSDGDGNMEELEAQVSLG